MRTWHSPPSENPTDPEQLLVVARAYQAKGFHSREPLQLEQANERAVAAYEALLRLQPDNLRALHTLSMLYRRTGRIEAATTLALRLANLRATSAFAQLGAARELLDLGRLDEALHYISRARTLDPAGETLPSWHAAWFTLFDAQELWLRNDAAAALDATDRAAAAAVHLQGRRLEQSMLHIATMYLTLGRFGQADDAISRMSADEHSPVPDTWRALVLLAREDIPGLQVFLETNFGTVQKAQQVGSLLVDAGMLAEAREVVARWPSLPYSSQLALAEGRLDEAIRGFQLALARLSNPGRPRTTRKLAQALTRKGDIAGAIAVLEVESRRRVAMTAGISSGLRMVDPQRAARPTLSEGRTRR
jgi:tetratricopeptide (TPR) repeat protein